MKKRILSVILSTLMVLSLFPVEAALAVASQPTVSVETCYAQPGDSVNVKVTIKNNPGIIGSTMSLSYDSGLTLISASNGEAFSALTLTKPGKFSSPCNFVWDATNISPEEIKDGTILTLTFSVADTVDEGRTLGVRLTATDATDVKMNDIQFKVVSGSVGIINYIPGDVDSNKKVNTTDVIQYRRHLAGGYGTTIHEAAADVNADSKNNTSDVITIRRYLAGGYTDAVGDPLRLLPSPLGPLATGCEHDLVAVSYLAPTASEYGHINHWYCTKCGKYFQDEAGTTEIAESDVLLQPTTPTPVGDHAIIYDVANGDTYLEGLIAKGEISNNNPVGFDESVGVVSFRNLSVPGYRFLGWYDGAGDNASQVKKIDAGTTYDVELYAHWSKIEYTVQFKSDIFLEESEIKYTVDKGAVLPTPRLSNYVFTGWSDDSGKLYSKKIIPAGTTKDLTLTANWTSERNKTWTKKMTKDDIENPVIYEDEDNNIILFAYEIGEIQNVPLYTIKDFGYISGDGVTKTETETYSTTITESFMQSYAKAVASATTESSNWTLSENWNETTSIDEQWCQERGITQAEAETIAKSDTGTWNISNSKNGSTDTTHVETNQDNWENQVKINSSSESTTKTKEAASLGSTIGAHYEAKAGASAMGASAEVSAGVSAELRSEISVENENSSTDKRGLEVGGASGNTQTTSDTSVTSSGWSNTASYGGSSTSSRSATTSTELSEKLSSKYGYGKSYIKGGGSSNTQGLSATNSSSDEYGSSVTYSTATSESRTSTWTTQSTKAGYHRWIVAGTAHVFGVVGYDMATESYFVYTYSIMDDETHEFEDYSYTTANYNDHQNGVISFEIPYYVAQYVSSRVNHSAGLKVNQNTGIITGYSGIDDCVVIPEYMNVGSGQVVKVTGISENAFCGNQNIKTVVLSDFITEIPNNAFKNCTSLIGVVGGEITRIGDQAFSGCVSMKDCGITRYITSLGTDAFNGVAKLMVNAANAGIVQAAVDSGADEVVLYLKQLTDSLDGEELFVSDETSRFELNGYGQTYRDISIESNADTTVINKCRFVSSSKIPLQLASSEVTLNDVTADAFGIAMVLSWEETNLRLQGDINVISANTNALLCKNVTLYESNPNVDGSLRVSDKILVCGNVNNDNLLIYQTYEKITAETFERLLHSYTLYFDPDGGECSTASKVVPNGVAIGPLPVPTKDNYTFTGWYLADGTPVTEETVFSMGLDQTAYAHWSLNTYTVYFNANGGTCTESSREVLFGAAYGLLPFPAREFYTFGGWYTAANGGDAVSADTVSSGDATIYAHWTLNPTSDWVLKSSMPTGAQVVQTKWLIQSSKSNIDGFTLYDTTSVWGDYGAWSGWSDSPHYKSDSRDVDTRDVIGSYTLDSCTDADSYGYRRYFKYHNNSYYLRYDRDPITVSVDTFRGLNSYAEGSWYGYASNVQGYIMGPGTGYAGDATDWVPMFVVSENYKTQWRYRDRSKIYTYYLQKIENGESNNVPSGDGITNVQEWVQYRAK